MIVARDNLAQLQAYVPGESGALGAIKLSANENPLGASAQVFAALKDVAALHRYPDGGCGDLRAAIAELHGLDAARIVCGNGSGEILSLLVQAYAGTGDEILYSEHGFLLYPIAARSVGAGAVAAPETALCADVDALLAAVTDKTKMLFLANPNNPTGSYLARDELLGLRDGLREDVLLVVDDAYAEYVTAGDYLSGLELMALRANVVATRTFSKIYGLGGVRLGWGYMPEDVAANINKIRGPFNVSNVAQIAGIAALGDQNHLAMSVEHNSLWRARLASGLAELGFVCYPSQANFVLVECGDEARAGAVDAQLRAAGIFVRQVGAYGLPSCLRVTVGTADENVALLEALS